jgi:hypothetical protein
LKKKKFPTKDEFILFMFNDPVSKQKATLSFLLQKLVDVVLNGYQSIISENDSTNFTTRILRSSCPPILEAMESGKAELILPSPAPSR